MSVEDLLAKWEEALGVALSQPDKWDAIEYCDGDLETVADLRMARLRSNVRAGAGASLLACGFTAIIALCIPW